MNLSTPMPKSVGDFARCFWSFIPIAQWDEANCPLHIHPSKEKTA